MVNYYEILGIEEDSSIQEIKKSFRKKAKEMHPDVNCAKTKPISAEQMLLLLQAYKILSNPQKKREYDSIFAHKIKPFLKTQQYVFNYREFLQSQEDDPFSLSKLIFYDLLNSREEEALSLYETLLADESYNIERYLDREDYLECLFLLSEELEKRGEFIRAFEYLKTIYYKELSYPYFKHFIDEIVNRMKNIVCFKMSGLFPQEIILQHLSELVNFNFSNKDNAFFYKKMAEIALKKGNRNEAIQYLNLGLSCNKNLSGIKKLLERIGV